MFPSHIYTVILRVITHYYYYILKYFTDIPYHELFMWFCSPEIEICTLIMFIAMFTSCFKYMFDIPYRRPVSRLQPPVFHCHHNGVLYLMSILCTILCYSEIYQIVRRSRLRAFSLGRFLAGVLLYIYVTWHYRKIKQKNKTYTLPTQSNSILPQKLQSSTHIHLTWGGHTHT